MFTYGAIDDLYQKTTRFSKLKLFLFIHSIRFSMVYIIHIWKISPGEIFFANFTTCLHACTHALVLFVCLIAVCMWTTLSTSACRECMRLGSRLASSPWSSRGRSWTKRDLEVRLVVFKCTFVAVYPKVTNFCVRFNFANYASQAQVT